MPLTHRSLRNTPLWHETLGLLAAGREEHLESLVDRAGDSLNASPGSDADRPDPGLRGILFAAYAIRVLGSEVLDLATASTRKAEKQLGVLTPRYLALEAAARETGTTLESLLQEPESFRTHASYADVLWRGLGQKRLRERVSQGGDQSSFSEEIRCAIQRKGWTSDALVDLLGKEFGPLHDPQDVRGLLMWLGPDYLRVTPTSRLLLRMPRYLEWEPLATAIASGSDGLTPEWKGVLADHWVRMYAAVSGIVSSEGGSQDDVHDVLARLLEEGASLIPKYRFGSSLTRWLVALCIRRRNEELRRGAKVQVQVFEDDHYLFKPPPDVSSRYALLVRDRLEDVIEPLGNEVRLDRALALGRALEARLREELRELIEERKPSVFSHYLERNRVLLERLWENEVSADVDVMAAWVAEQAMSRILTKLPDGDARAGWEPLPKLCKYSAPEMHERLRAEFDSPEDKEAIGTITPNRVSILVSRLSVGDERLGEDCLRSVYHDILGFRRSKS